MKSWVASLLPEGAVTDKSEAVGRQLASAVLSGEVVSARRFGSDDAAFDVPEGFSAVSVPARGVQAVGGALRPGMRVDLYAVGSASTTQVLSGALVLESSAMDSGAGRFLVERSVGHACRRASKGSGAGDGGVEPRPVLRPSR